MSSSHFQQEALRSAIRATDVLELYQAQRGMDCFLVAQRLATLVTGSERKAIQQDSTLISKLIRAIHQRVRSSQSSYTISTLAKVSQIIHP